jgi:hypothetical protein
MDHISRAGYYCQWILLWKLKQIILSDEVSTLGTLKQYQSDINL